MAMHFLSSLPSPVPPDFTPSPDETWALLSSPPPSPPPSLPSSPPSYAVPNNLIISFDKDTIDQSPRLTSLLQQRGREGGRGGGRVESVRLSGTHLTPNTPQGVLDVAMEGGGEGGREGGQVWDSYGRKWVEEVGAGGAGGGGAGGAAAQAVARTAKRELDA